MAAEAYKIPAAQIDGMDVVAVHEATQEALKRLREPWPRVAVSSPTDLIRLLEFQNMRCVAKMVCRAALERTESRGSHFRNDYPAEDNRIWLKNIVLRKSDSGINVEAKPVRLDLVELEV